MTTTTPKKTTEFLSIKDAAERYQKAQITIRRFVRTMLEKEKHPDRQFIHPLPKEALKMRKEHKPFVYTIAVDLLHKHFSIAEGSQQTKDSETKGEYRELLERMNMSLTDQLKVKDEQIRVLSQAIDDLSERQRETNILMKGLQEKLLLAPPAQKIVDVPEAPRKKSWWRWRRG